jgi:acyl carrier protein
VNDDIDLQIRTVLAAVLNRGMKAEDISVDADLVNEYGIDSLEMISFLLAIEDAFDLELDYDNLELNHLRSVREFAGFVAIRSVKA